MSFYDVNDPEYSAPLAEINMVPLIDVMLVLLVIFLVTAPLLTHAVKVELPKASSTPNLTKPETIQFSITASGAMYWNNQITNDADLKKRFSVVATWPNQPDLHIRADRTTRYEKVAQVMSEASRAGIRRIGFVTDPSSP